MRNETYPIVMLDAIHLKVRLARRVVSVPVLVDPAVELRARGGTEGSELILVQNFFEELKEKVGN